MNESHKLKLFREAVLNTAGSHRLVLALNKFLLRQDTTQSCAAHWVVWVVWQMSKEIFNQI